VIAIPLADLPEAEPLPTALLEPDSEAWQRGLRLVDRSDGAGGRVTAGSWQSGVFRTRPFTFGGHEWMWVIEGCIEVAADHGRWLIRQGEAGLIPAGLCCTWTQLGPVTKVFLRWDGTLPDSPVFSAPWLSSAPERSFGYAGREGILLAAANTASWLSATHKIRIAIFDTVPYLTEEPSTRLTT
jgi:uncharacterized cupin superfamily protein